MDWVRRPYTTKCRFFADPSAPIVDIVWYPTDRPFLDRPTVFGSADWDEAPWTRTGPGEIFGEPRKYNGRKVLPFGEEQHFCGTTEQFLDGLPWPNPAPPARYDGDGVPLCCGREPTRPLALAVTFGADVTYVPPITPPGTDCATAKRIEAGQIQSYTLSGLGASHWYRLTTQVGVGNYYLHSTTALFLNAFYFTYLGPCETLTPVPRFYVSDNCVIFQENNGRDVLLSLVNPSVVPVSYSFELSLTSCS